MSVTLPFTRLWIAHNEENHTGPNLLNGLFAAYTKQLKCHILWKIGHSYRDKGKPHGNLKGFYWNQQNAYMCDTSQIVRAFSSGHHCFTIWATPKNQSPINAQLVLLSIRQEIWRATLIWSKWVKGAIKRCNLVTSSIWSHWMTARCHFVAKGSKLFLLGLKLLMS